MVPVSAYDVAAELRRQLPGLRTKKLHTLLYYCQSHHLAHFGEPLFAESVIALGMGPVVAQLWKAENDGRLPDAAQALGAGQLNTIGYVISRYGRLTAHDLELLSHAEDPWRAAGGPEPDLPWPATQDIAGLAVGSERRRQNAPAPDDLGELARRRLPR